MNTQGGSTGARLLSLVLVLLVAFNLASCRGARRLSLTDREGAVTHSYAVRPEQYPMLKHDRENGHRRKIAQPASSYRHRASQLRLASWDADSSLALSMGLVAADMATLAYELDRLANSHPRGYDTYSDADWERLSRWYLNLGWSLNSLASNLKLNGNYLAGSEIDEMADKHLQIATKIRQMAQ